MLGKLAKKRELIILKELERNPYQTEKELKINLNNTNPINGIEIVLSDLIKMELIGYIPDNDKSTGYVLKTKGKKFMAKRRKKKCQKKH